MIQCDNCHIDLDRRVFCNAACKLKYHRGNDTNRIKDPIIDTNRIKSDTNRIKVMPVPLAEALEARPPLSYRDAKGQCQHRLKRYCAFGCYKKK